MNDLNELAAAYGVGTSYVDWRGRHTDVSSETIRAVLTSLGVDTGSADAVRDELERLGRERRERLLPPSVVAYAGEEILAARGAGLRVALTGGGEVGLAPAGPAADDGRQAYHLPPEVPPGLHTVHARAGDREESVPLLVAPARAPEPAGREWGFMAQLYSARSRGSWGSVTSPTCASWRRGALVTSAPGSCWSTRCTPVSPRRRSAPRRTSR